MEFLNASNVSPQNSSSTSTRLKISGPLKVGHFMCGDPCSSDGFERRKSCQYPGQGAELIHFLTSWIGTSYQIIPLHGEMEEIFGVLHNQTGRWSGTLGGVQDGLFDTVDCPTIQTLERVSSFDMTSPIMFQDTMFVTSTPQPTHIKTMTRLLTVLRPKVLLLLAISILLLVRMLRIAEVVLRRKRSHLENFLYLIKNIFSFSICSNNYSHTSERILFIALWYSILFFTGLYQGCLLTFLLIPPKHAAITSEKLLQRIKDREVQIVAIEYEWKDYGTWQMVKHSNEDKYKLFQEALAANPPLLMPDDTTYSDIGKLIHESDGRLVYFGDSNARDLLSAQCKYPLHEISIENNENIQASYIFRKGSPWAALFNHAIIQNYAFALNISERYMTQKFCTTAELKKLHSAEQKPSVDRLRLKNVLGCFADIIYNSVLSAGLLLSCLVAIGEKIRPVLEKVLKRFGATSSNETVDVDSYSQWELRKMKRFSSRRSL